MGILESVLKEELDRLKELRKQYTLEISKLPRGCLIRKKINGNEYFYLNYRNGKKSVFKYIGKLSTKNIKELRSKIEKRRKLWKLDIKAKHNIKNLNKIIHEKEN